MRLALRGWPRARVVYRSWALTMQLFDNQVKGMVMSTVLDPPYCIRRSRRGACPSRWAPRKPLTAGPSNFNVTATVANFCTVSAANVVFGSVNAGAAATNTASTRDADLQQGRHGLVVVSQRRLERRRHAEAHEGWRQRRLPQLQHRQAHGRRIQYAAPPLARVRNGTPADIVATPLFTATGGAKLINICASIPAGQFPSAGSYSDTVSVTATYN